MEPTNLLTIDIRHKTLSWKPQRLLKTLIEKSAPGREKIIHETFNFDKIKMYNSIES